MTLRPDSAAARQFLPALGPAPALRVALVVDAPASAWAVELLQDLHQAPWLQVQWVAEIPRRADAGEFVDASDPQWAHEPRWMARREAGRRRNVDRSLDPMAIVPWPEELRRGPHGPLPWLSWVAASADRRDVDVLLWCANAPAETLASGTNGPPTWSLQAGTDRGTAGHRSRVAESLARSTLTAITLVELGETPVPRELLSLPLRRLPDPWRATSGPELAWEGRTLVLRALRERHAAAGGAPEQAPPQDDLLPVSTRSGGPGWWRTVRWGAGELQRAWRRVARKRALGREWRMALRPRTDTGTPLWDGGSWQGQVLEQPASQFWADPFLVEEGDTTWLFFETYQYGLGHGTLSVAAVLENGQLGPVRECLATGSHLSYPQVFRHDGEYFMIPESTEAGTVCLYRARRFPDDWVLEKVLFRGHAVDTTCLNHHGHWYFFTSLSGYGAQFPVQCLFTADSLLGEWRAHPASPVSMGLRAERGAGAIFADGTRLIRPVQDGLLGYGHSLAFHEITRLDGNALQERRLATLKPDWAPGLLGTHSYARSSRWEVVDALWNRYR